jgi:hypothetical protein
LQAVVDAVPVGGTVDLGSCVYSGSAAVVSINKPVTIRRGTLKPTGFNAVSIRANDVTLDGIAFDGGGWTVRILGVDRTKILRSTFRNMRETSIYIAGPGVDDTLIEGNTIIQSVVTAHGYSPIAGQGPGGTNRNVVIRGNTIDNGPPGVAWFGIEIFETLGLVIEGNTTKGAGAHISVPRSDGVIIRNNTLDLTTAFWGMEIPDVDNARVLNNVAFTTGTIDLNKQWRALVQLHPGSGTVNGTLIMGNRLTRYAALVNAPPTPAAGKPIGATTVKDNCLSGVGRVSWGTWVTPVVLASNGPCP